VFSSPLKNRGLALAFSQTNLPPADLSSRHLHLGVNPRLRSGESPSEYPASPGAELPAVRAGRW